MLTAFLVIAQSLRVPIIFLVPFDLHNYFIPKQALFAFYLILIRHNSGLMLAHILTLHDLEVVPELFIIVEALVVDLNLFIILEDDLILSALEVVLKLYLILEDELILSTLLVDLGYFIILMELLIGFTLKMFLKLFIILPAILTLLVFMVVL